MKNMIIGRLRIKTMILNYVLEFDQNFHMIATLFHD